MGLAKTLWTQIQDLVTTGQTISNNLDTAFSNIDTAIDQVDLNTNDILSNKNSITTLQDINIYYFNKVSSISTTSEVYTEANRLVVVAPPSGVYEYKFSMTFNYSSTTRSAFFRFSTDGGSTWDEVVVEAKDVTDNYPVYHAFPIQWTQQTIPIDMDLVIEYRTEVDGDVLNVSDMDIVIERKA